MNNQLEKKREEILGKTVNAVKAISDTNGLIWRTTEWNICHHLACKLEKEFTDFNVDIELEKLDGRRPDIVIHGRGNNERNLIIFQVKKNPSSSDIIDDLEKIKDTFFNKPYFYKFGIFISIGKLPSKIPEYNKSKIGIIQVDGWDIINI
jgi:hypothetical protein